MTGTGKIPVSVLVIIHSADGQVLLLERTDHPGFWQSVTGSIDTPEEPLQHAALRELEEETGFVVKPDDCVATGWRHVYPIYLHWRRRYAPGVLHNTEHVFQVRLPHAVSPRLAPREHRAAQWWPWREAADRCFSWTNALAIRRLYLTPPCELRPTTSTKV